MTDGDDLSLWSKGALALTQKCHDVCIKQCLTSQSLYAPLFLLPIYAPDSRCFCFVKKYSYELSASMTIDFCLV